MSKRDYTTELLKLEDAEIERLEENVGVSNIGYTFAARESDLSREGWRFASGASKYDPTLTVREKVQWIPAVWQTCPNSPCLLENV